VQGLLAASARQKLAEIVRRLVEATGDREIAWMRRLAVQLHTFFYYGPGIVELTEEEAAEAVKDLVDWVRRKARQYGL